MNKLAQLEADKYLEVSDRYINIPCTKTNAEMYDETHIELTNIMKDAIEIDKVSQSFASREEHTGPKIIIGEDLLETLKINPSTINNALQYINEHSAGTTRENLEAFQELSSKTLGFGKYHTEEIEKMFSFVKDLSLMMTHKDFRPKYSLTIVTRMTLSIIGKYLELGIKNPLNPFFDYAIGISKELVQAHVESPETSELVFDFDTMFENGEVIKVDELQHFKCFFINKNIVTRVKDLTSFEIDGFHSLVASGVGVNSMNWLEENRELCLRESFANTHTYMAKFKEYMRNMVIKHRLDDSKLVCPVIGTQTSTLIESIVDCSRNSLLRLLLDLSTLYINSNDKTVSNIQEKFVKDVFIEVLKRCVEDGESL